MPRPSGVPGVLRAHPLAAGVAISALLSAVYLLWQPHTLDLAAQTYRADLWSEYGWTIWSPDWYGGFTVPGYSLLYPPLGARLGPELLGALSAVAAAALFGLIALRAFGERAWLGIVWFGLASTVALYGGRTTFALGLALGLATVLAIQRDRKLLAAVGGALTAAASPVAGLFALLAAAAVIATAFWRRRAEGVERSAGGLPVAAALAAAGGAALILAALGIAFPTDGYQPFVFSAFIPIPLAVAAIWFLASPSRHDLLRMGALLYLALALAAIVIETPLGGNTVRLGATFAGPLAAMFLIRRRAVVLVLVAIPLLYWQWTATIRDVAAAEGDPSTEAAYYEPVLSEIKRAKHRAGYDVRVHVPATRNRWEAVYVAERYAIDGGWLRQLESSDEDVYESGDAAGYLEWLRSRGVSILAVNDAEPDHSAEYERSLLDEPAFPLSPVYEDAHWRLYEIGDGPALRQLGADHFLARIGDSGSTDLQVRYSDYFEVTGGTGCVERLGDEPGFGEGLGTRISGEPGKVLRVQARFSLDAALGRDRSCGEGPMVGRDAFVRASRARAAP